jgi:hypothetical protein
MPIEPSVFHPIRSRDVTERTFKAYKHHDLSSASFSNLSGHMRHEGVFLKHTPHVSDFSYDYPLNEEDNTNQHVTWNVLDHKYYRYPYDPAKSTEHHNRNLVTKFLAPSASSITVPYINAGESIKPGSVTLVTNMAGGLNQLDLYDDADGNLRDTFILTSSMPPAHQCYFHMSFNDEYRQFTSGDPNRHLAGMPLKHVHYTLNNRKHKAKIHGHAELSPGVDLVYPGAKHYKPIITTTENTSSGFCLHFPSASNTVPKAFDNRGSHIRIPYKADDFHFNADEDWAISLWYCITNQSAVQNAANETFHLISKYGVETEQYLDSKDKKLKILV